MDKMTARYYSLIDTLTVNTFEKDTQCSYFMRPYCTRNEMIRTTEIQGYSYDLYMGWDDFDLIVPPFCPAAQPHLPNSH